MILVGWSLPDASSRKLHTYTFVTSADAQCLGRTVPLLCSACEQKIISTGAGRPVRKVAPAAAAVRTARALAAGD